jgi:uncharacterized membrane protein YraQ (UPF0718 family)
LLHTAPFVAFAVIAIGWLRASEAEGLVAAAFQGRESRMIVLAALVGGLTPFCSCEVIPFVAALLAAGTPLSAVMAFWLASPLMDPPAFAITVGALGWDYAIAKTTAAVAVGLFGGFGMKLMLARGAFADPLRPRESVGSCCGGPKREPQLRGWFWPEAERRAVEDKVDTSVRVMNAESEQMWETLNEKAGGDAEEFQKAHDELYAGVQECLSLFFERPGDKAEADKEG